MNLVLADTEEFRRTRKKQTKAAPGSTAAPATEEEARRTLGLVIVRGTTIISLSVDGPPPTDPAARLGASATAPAGGAPATLSAGPGISRPAGRGSSLQGPAVGVGGPAFGFPPAGGPPGGPRKFDSSRERCAEADWTS
jgi:small nuclear ribonucleoprotein B and B'